MVDLARPNGVYTQPVRRSLATGDAVPARTFVWAGRYGDDPGGSQFAQWAGEVEYTDAPSLESLLTTAHIGDIAFQGGAPRSSTHG